jgi:hypothetical protein
VHQSGAGQVAQAGEAGSTAVMNSRTAVHHQISPIENSQVVVRCTDSQFFPSPVKVHVKCAVFTVGAGWSPSRRTGKPWFRVLTDIGNNTTKPVSLENRRHFVFTAAGTCAKRLRTPK